MPDVTAQVNELKGLPDQALQMELTNPSGAVPAYLVLAEAQRRQLMRQSALTQQNQAPVGSVYDDVIRSMMARQPPPGAAPAGMPPVASAPPAAPQTPQNFRLATGMAEGGEVEDDDDADGGGFDLDSAIDRIAREHGRDPNEMRAIVRTESRNDPNAVSPKGAQGLMQLMPATSRYYGAKNPMDPEQNLEAGASYLDDLYGQYPDDPQLVHAAWNAGPSRVKQYGGIPPFKETQKFVRLVDQYTKANAQSASARAVESEMPEGSGTAGLSDAAPALARPFTSPNDWRQRQLDALQPPVPGAPRAPDRQLADYVLASGTPSPAPPPGPWDPVTLKKNRATIADLMGGADPNADEQELRARVRQMEAEADARRHPNFWNYLTQFGLGMATTPSRNWAQSIAGGAAGMVQGIGAQQEAARKQKLELMGIDLKLDDQMRAHQMAYGKATLEMAQTQQAAIDAAERAHAAAEAQAQKELLRDQTAARRNSFNHALAFPMSVAGTHDAPPTPEYKDFIPDPDDPARGVWVPPSQMQVIPEISKFVPKDPATGLPVQAVTPAQYQAYQTTARSVAQHDAEKVDKAVRPPELTDKVLQYWARQGSIDPANLQLMPAAFKPFVAAEMANTGVDLKRLDATSRAMAVPQDPKEVDYWLRQVANDPKNFTLIQGNKGLAEAVRKGAPAAGLNMNQIDAMTRDAATFSRAALTHLGDIRSGIDSLGAKGKLGPLASRWGSFLAGTWGSGDPEYNKLRSNIKLLQTAMSRVHGGARGGSSPYMAESMNSIMNAKTMDPAMLRSSLGVFENWLQTYANMAPGTALGAPTGAPGAAQDDPFGILGGKK
jgi:soluble lytic murein transglycosylase-like protein